jgi:hypothetical protein
MHAAMRVFRLPSAGCPVGRQSALFTGYEELTLAERRAFK